MKSFVDQAFNRIAVWIFLAEKFHMDDRMFFQELLNFRGIMGSCLVNEKNDFLKLVSFGIRDKIAEMFAEFDVSSTFVAVPNDVLLWPEQSDEEVASLGISQRWYQELLVFTQIASLNTWKKFYPLFILKA
jgi:hypothetical protein